MSGIPHTLALYFGDESAVNGGKCGNCTVCVTGRSATSLTFDSALAACETPDRAQIEAVLARCPLRDDARLLARIAFGVTSPRVTKAKWNKYQEFGSMASSDFNDLVEAFEAFCIDPRTDEKPDIKPDINQDIKPDIKPDVGSIQSPATFYDKINVVGSKRSFSSATHSRRNKRVRR